MSDKEQATPTEEQSPHGGTGEGGDELDGVEAQRERLLDVACKACRYREQCADDHYDCPAFKILDDYEDDEVEGGE